MSSKCWFVLRQHHYPPPVFPKTGSGKMGGPLCLGHIIPDLRHIDNVINTKEGPLAIPPDMPIYPTRANNFKWEGNAERGFDASVNVGVPIAAAAGITVKAETAVAFQRSVHNFWEFDALETHIIQPTEEYVEDSVENEQVAAWLEKRRMFKSPSVFMITGLMIARGGTNQTSTGKQTEANLRPGVELPAIAEAGIGLGTSRSTSSSLSASKWSDFVWAIRLAKISQGLLDRSWSHETVSKGATLGLEESQDETQNGAAQMAEALAREGLEDLDLEVGDDMVFICAQPNYPKK
ncbi:hypothetical protein PG996_013707 [Apiospora saccharicola]|uniref:Uncharacterized protein n=1 Tax=Apiospora saccharicola TaxID=335842 RepID=A0ABR1U678_9PEZI